MTKRIPPFLLLVWSASLTAQEPGHFRFEILAPDSSMVVAYGEFMVAPERIVGMEVAPEHHRDLGVGDPRWIRRRTAEGDVCFGVQVARSPFEGREFYPGIIDSGIAAFDAYRVEGEDPGFYLYISPDASARLVGTFSSVGASGWLHQRDFDREGPVVWLPFRATRMGNASDEVCRAILDIVTTRGGEALEQGIAGVRVGCEGNSLRSLACARVRQQNSRPLGLLLKTAWLSPWF